jgi:hypothetical protein
MNFRRFSLAKGGRQRNHQDKGNTSIRLPGATPMSTPTATRRHHPEEPCAAVPHGDHRRLTLVRMVAAAHLVAGAVIALSVSGNLALRLDYSGGPMGYYGSQSIGMAGCLHTFTHIRVWSASAFQERLGAYTVWIFRHAQMSREFFGLMVGVHFCLAGLCAAIGYGLWRCQSWARKSCRIMIGVSAAFATTHGVALLAVGFGYLGEGFEILVITAIVAAPILILLRSPSTAALFNRSVSPGPGVAQKRRWWTLTAQWLMAGLVCVFALGLVRLLLFGPLVEIVWAAVLLT